MYYLGVDIGTSGCKAVAFDADGRQAAAAYREYDVRFTGDGGAELDSELVMTRCFDVLREVAAALPAAEIRGLGISSQGEAFTTLDTDGRALTHGMVSSDVRAAEYARTWPATFGVDRLYRRTGHTAHPMFTVFKLMWLRDHRPEVWAKAARFLCYEDLLQARLGLAPTIAWPLAGRTMMFDVTRHVWDAEILAAVGVRPEQMARPVAAGTRVGCIRPDIAASLGLAAETFVVAGGHDQPCGALGAGVTRPGTAMYVTGTVDCITPGFAAARFTDALRDSNLCTYDHTVPGMYATVAFNLTGGNLLKWFRDEFGDAEVREAAARGVDPYQVLLERAGEAPSKLLTMPYFTATGTPYFDTTVSGAVLGLRLTTSRGELIRGLLEGVALEMRLNLDIMERSGWAIDELRLVGGGARSAVWNQLKADVLGKPMTALDVTEAGCLGCAMLACAADTRTPVAELAERWVRPVATVTPRPEVVAAYDERFALYRQLYPTLRELSRRLGEKRTHP